MHSDEGYVEADGIELNSKTSAELHVPAPYSADDCEDLIYKLLENLPRARSAAVKRRIARLLHFDVVGSLPAEISLQIFSHLPAKTLLTCALVSRKWKTLADDQTLWYNLCEARGWEWRQPSQIHPFDSALVHHGEGLQVSDDEGMGDSDEDDDHDLPIHDVEAAKVELTMMQAELDSGFASMTLPGPISMEAGPSNLRHTIRPSRQHRGRSKARHSAPAVLKTDASPSGPLRPDYKLLHQTHTKLHNRFLSSSYRLSALQTRGAPTNAHSSTIYCLQLYTYPSGLQVLFTGSRDKSVREWNLKTGLVERVINNLHDGSLLSICVYNGYLATAGSDCRVVVWDLGKNEMFGSINDHTDSVLCVRFDDEHLVSCSKDNTVRVYSFPGLEAKHVLRGHRAAVNAVSITKHQIVSGSGDRSIKLWDIKTGRLLRTFDFHHKRGIASIDFDAPWILTGSSDKHLRLVDINTSQGWSTSPEYQAEHPPQPHSANTIAPSTDLPAPHSRLMCQVCGSENIHTVPPGVQGPCMHSDLVRSVVLGEDLVVSGSYDLSIKVWDRRTGAMIADLTGGHTARIFCIGFDHTKIVSCGEDQRICIWDFSHGIDTSFLRL